MKILFKKEVIGKIENIYNEEYWVHGNFIPYDGYYKYKDFLNAMVSEDGMDEGKYDAELFNENNWFASDNNDLKGIWVPAVYEDGDVSIRYR